MHSFQYKLLNNVLFFEKKLYLCGITNSLLCVFCGLTDGTSLHLFYECNSIKSLRNQLCMFFDDVLKLLYYGIMSLLTNEVTLHKNRLYKSHILLVFKLYIYNSREKHMLNINILLNNIAKVIKVEENTASHNEKKITAYTRKCKIINN